MNTCELHYSGSATSVQIMKAHGSFVRMGFLVIKILRVILFKTIYVSPLNSIKISLKSYTLGEIFLYITVFRFVAEQLKGSLW